MWPHRSVCSIPNDQGAEIAPWYQFQGKEKITSFISCFLSLRSASRRWRHQYISADEAGNIPLNIFERCMNMLETASGKTCIATLLYLSCFGFQDKLFFQICLTRVWKFFLLSAQIYWWRHLLGSRSNRYSLSIVSEFYNNCTNEITQWIARYELQHHYAW